MSPDSTLFAELNAIAAEKGLTAAELLAIGLTKSCPLYDLLDVRLGLLLDKVQSYQLIASRKTELSAALMFGWTRMVKAVFYGAKNRLAIADSSRAIYRILAELKKLQGWRRYMDVHDIQDLQPINDAYECFPNQTGSQQHLCYLALLDY